jgi:hypothetical protein
MVSETAMRGGRMVTKGDAIMEDLFRSMVIDPGDIAQVVSPLGDGVLGRGGIPDDLAARLLELAAVVDQLRRTLGDDAARQWLRAQNPSLDGRRPIDLITEGQYQLVLGAILAMGEGVTA